MNRECPTPAKRGYPSERAAKHSRHRHGVSDRLRAYHCRCGLWHLTHQSKAENAA